jgi:hypothetical protein
VCEPSRGEEGGNEGDKEGRGEAEAPVIEAGGGARCEVRGRWGWSGVRSQEGGGALVVRSCKRNPLQDVSETEKLNYWEKEGTAAGDGGAEGRSQEGRSFSGRTCGSEGSRGGGRRGSAEEHGGAGKATGAAGPPSGSLA